MSIELIGCWKKGFAYDEHTLSSTYLGVSESGREHWNTTRSKMGELVYQLKYKENNSVIGQIVDLIEQKFVGIEEMNAIIPIPASNNQRAIQPVIAIALELGKRVGVSVLADALAKIEGVVAMKDIDNPSERKTLLSKQMLFTGTYNLSGANVLLLDDLYRSGSTLEVATNLLYDQAHCRAVYVLTMTKTRSKR